MVQDRRSGIYGSSRISRLRGCNMLVIYTSSATFCQCSYFLSIGYYHKQAICFVADIFHLICQCSHILSNWLSL